MQSRNQAPCLHIYHKSIQDLKINFNEILISFNIALIINVWLDAYDCTVSSFELWKTGWFRQFCLWLQNPPRAPLCLPIYKTAYKDQLGEGSACNK